MRSEMKQATEGGRDCAQSKEHGYATRNAHAGARRNLYTRAREKGENMARPRKYTTRTLRKAVENYFDARRYELPAVREVWKGAYDEKGHKQMESEPILDKRGNQIMLQQWIQLPSLVELQLQLGINRSTWARWAEDPELGEVVEYARAVVEAALERELAGKNTAGIIFNLSHNFGWKDTKEVQITGGVEQFLLGLEEQGEGKTF